MKKLSHRQPMHN